MYTKLCSTSYIRSFVVYLQVSFTKLKVCLLNLWAVPGLRIGEIIVSNILQGRAAFRLPRFVCRLSKLKAALACKIFDTMISRGNTRDYRGLKEVTGGYKELQGVTRGYKPLHRVTGSYYWLHEIRRGLQGVTGSTRGYNRLQGRTRGYRWLQKVTRAYRELPLVTGRY